MNKHLGASEQRQIHYQLRLTTTDSGIGFFACYPPEEMAFEECVTYLRSHPNDSFMHQHILNSLVGMNEKAILELIKRIKAEDPVFYALVYEANQLCGKLGLITKDLKGSKIKTLADYTPLIHIKSKLQEDQALHYQWIKIFGENINAHRLLPAPESTGLPYLFDAETLSTQGFERVHIRDIFKCTEGSSPYKESPSPKETAWLALEKLQEYNIIADIEMRHVATLSPIALLRKWNMNISVKNGRLDYSLSGIQTSYGRGLTLEDARASYSMEMVERCSSFASITPRRISGYRNDYPLRRATYHQLVENGLTALDPNHLRLEIPYSNEVLHWMEAQRQTGKTLESIWIPVQTVFLFCNLDEINLFSGLGSTGLASGNTLEEAKLSALLEVIERDGEAVTLYHPSRCFKLRSANPKIESLLRNYRQNGVCVQFQDISSSFGIPCYKCFVIGPQGQIVKGTGGHLNGQKAVVSALTETPYPFPYSPPSRLGPEGLQVICLEDLPDFSTSHPGADLALLETVLITNGYSPIYVDLTRQDLGLPVVKVIVPGMEWMADFDRFSRVSPKLFNNYLQLSNPSN